MQKTLTALLAGVAFLSAISTMADETRVVIVPLGGKKVAGDAVTADVLAGKTFSNKDDVGLTGTMPDNGGMTFTPGTADQNLPEGYHNGSGVVKGDAGLVPENIKSGITIFGVTGTFTDPPALVGTVTSAGGRIWMDRNLGAPRVAISSTDSAAYGDLYQWGRLTDGHEKRTSATTFTLSINDVPGHGDFIVPPGTPHDWRTSQNDNLWQGASGINNPCPSGFRLPTEAEWNNEITSWSSRDSVGAFASPLKLVLAGIRRSGNGTIDSEGSYGFYWSSTVEGIYGLNLEFDIANHATIYGAGRALGFSVRCIKD
ncbi:MAG: fibrobacter succinogenes major paralogous domain-containing protein [Desulfobulbaceae bacterium]